MILAFVEHADGRPSTASVDALGLASELAAGLSMPLDALLLGSGAATAAAALEGLTISTAYVAEEDAVAAYGPATWGRCLADLVATATPRAVVAAATTRGQEVLGHAAALADLPLAAGCVALRPADAERPPKGVAVTTRPLALDITRLRWGGSVLEDARIQAPTVFVTIADRLSSSDAAEPSRPNLRLAPPAADSAPAAGPRVVRLAVAPRSEDLRVRLVEHQPHASGGVTLGRARVVVGGGRGVGGPEGFGPLEELAALLGGAVGVSRVATSAGWRPHAEQIGQTGTRIAPELYIACGISGAIQHIVGCRGAKAILAINTDPDAPIMSRATYAVIGDLREVVPAVNAELRRVSAGG